jgi:translation initiation factor 2B subunit (eIF-2B alpha/beta/delta family)
LRNIPRRYDGILLVGGAYKKGSRVDAVRDVKATVYDGTGGTFDAVGEFEPSLLGVKRMIAVARLDRSDAGWGLKIVNQSYDVTPGDFVSLLRGALRLS